MAIRHRGDVLANRSRRRRTGDARQQPQIADTRDDRTLRRVWLCDRRIRIGRAWQLISSSKRFSSAVENPISARLTSATCASALSSIASRSFSQLAFSAIYCPRGCRRACRPRSTPRHQHRHLAEAEALGRQHAPMAGRGCIPPSSTRTGMVQPNLAIAAVICSTCAAECVRALLA